MARKTTTKKKSYTGLWVVLGLAAVGTAAYFLFFKKDKDETPEVAPPGTLPNLPQPTPVPTASVFPLKQGSRGKEVQALQRFLNQSDSTNKLTVDGIFGGATQRAWLKEQNGNVVTQEYYNLFVKRFEK